MSDILTPAQLNKCLPACRRKQELLPILNKYLKEYNITTIFRISHFLSQVGHESLDFNVLSENLNYSAEGLQKTFKKYFPDSNIAWRYARQPSAIANRAYANRMGNGPEASGDGWKYRGRGAIQCTGKTTYSLFAKASGKPLEAVGDYLETLEGAVHSACWFWAVNGLNKAADTNDVVFVTKKINGGTNGLDDRRNRLEVCLKALA